MVTHFDPLPNSPEIPNFLFFYLFGRLDNRSHVLVCPRREVMRFSDLTSKEVSDLWISAQEIGVQVENYHKASSTSYAIHDGPLAGQTVPHVHIHIIPRIAGDWKDNDKIYDAEVSDLWISAQEIGVQVENYHKASSTSYAIHDGPLAGQTVPHVHIHIIPRIAGDWKDNDKIYDAVFGLVLSKTQLWLTNLMVVVCGVIGSGSMRILREHEASSGSLSILREHEHPQGA
ncbi:Histidine triad, conserved site-containing protein [Artemisia annua]|uniref:Histidine triad, conserved site-containing protein n=1 Tax=Artemisia annua TaxID=35608 RepID=A0A2U1KW25_ARTAN|nr:Histidine triad, conserved site-containing protein [Artemisia annua]